MTLGAYWYTPKSIPHVLIVHQLLACASHWLFYYIQFLNSFTFACIGFLLGWSWQACPPSGILVCIVVKMIRMIFLHRMTIERIGTMQPKLSLSAYPWNAVAQGAFSLSLSMIRNANEVVSGWFLLLPSAQVCCAVVCMEEPNLIAAIVIFWSQETYIIVINLCNEMTDFAKYTFVRCFSVCYAHF